MSDVEVFPYRRGFAVRWTRGTEADEIEKALPAGYVVQWKRTVCDDEGNFAAPLRKHAARKARS